MKIMHISDDPLPDVRVEKMAYLSKKRGHYTSFAGPGFRSFALTKNFFDNLYFIPWNRYARLGIQPYFFRIKKSLKKIIEKVKPDIIHAHDVFAAKMIYDLKYPFVFDDHELISFEKTSDVECSDKIVDRIIGRYATKLWGSWEREICEKAPIITVSKDISEHYQDFKAETYVVPNYPSLFELSKIQLSEERDNLITAAYMGSDIVSITKPYRNLSGLTDIFKELGIRLVIIGNMRFPSSDLIISKGFIPHLSLYNVLSKYHIGLLTWKKHWFHKYANPNKPYIYAHSRIIVIVTSSIHNVVKAFNGKCRVIEDSLDLKSTLSELYNNRNTICEEGNKVKDHAMTNFIFELFEDKVIDAYRKS